MNNKIIINPLEPITCPDCGHDFPLSEGITRQMIERYEGEYSEMLTEERGKLEARLVQDIEKKALKNYQEKLEVISEKLADSEAANKKAAAKLKSAKEKAAIEARKELIEEANNLKEELEAKDSKLEEYRRAELTLRSEKKQLEDQKRDMSLEIERRLDKERQKIESDAHESYKLRDAEWRKKIEDAQRANEDLRKKLEQGSQQLQGEVLELEIENLLQASFSSDSVKPVRKGARGADVIQTVMLRNGSVCGQIIWETKRAENWSNSWIPKLKDDQQAAGGEIAVLVSSVFPAGLKAPFVQQDGVWLVKPEFVKPFAEALRTVLTESYRQRAATIGKGEKMEALYDYICSAQFAQKVRAIVDTYQQMRDDLEKEKSAMQRLWKKREGQLTRITTNVMGMCGELQGISSSTLPQLEGVAEL
ncbi:DUF2130 domain-containing protein [Alkalimarinus alittae]|uniref:DUF2130 domain-containing protein n=1 Tax=Alkalimarinus alittae TaxID=2961619 RepID=A0ABY6MX85_9ALTE|nr:DUF2130 domain-containing protein [Alkalimarinus alittae]UZE94441.1 DUF2130 domain-containing protein [Alkalimarinus alittae]